MSRLGAAALLALAVSLLGSCIFSHSYNCDKHDKAIQARELGRVAYSGGNYALAKTNYMNAVEWCTDNYEARIGLAHTCRAYGNELFRNSDELAHVGKLQQAERMFNDARDDNHSLAYRLFKLAMTERPDDLDPHYGLGLLLYERCTSPIASPWQPGDALNRQRERDECIEEFSIVIGKFDDKVRSSQAYRYRGLAYLAADRVEDGARDLQVFHDSRQDLYNDIVRRWPAMTPEEKKRKSAALTTLEKEMDDVREVIVLENGEMLRQSAELKKKEAKTPSEAKEISQRIAHFSSQQLVLEGMIKSWSLTKLGEVEQVLVKRCREYVDVFNRGKLSEVLPYLGPRSGEESALRQQVSSKIDRGTRFEGEIKFRTVVVNQESATVGFACTLATNQGKTADSNITIRWRLVGGQWLVAEHP